MRAWLAGLLVGILAGTALSLSAQGSVAAGPQIQRAFDAFQANATITNLTVTGTCTGCGTTSPGGSSTQVQFNDGGIFGGSSGLTYVKATGTLTATDFQVSGTSIKPLRGVTGSIGGSLLTAGACTGGNATVTGATTAMVASASPVADPDPGLSTGVVWDAFVASAGTVTVRVCGLVAVTPNATTYQVAVVP